MEYTKAGCGSLRVEKTNSVPPAIRDNPQKIALLNNLQEALKRTPMVRITAGDRKVAESITNTVRHAVKGVTVILRKTDVFVAREVQ